MGLAAAAPAPGWGSRPALPGPRIGRPRAAAGARARGAASHFGLVPAPRDPRGRLFPAAPAPALRPSLAPGPALPGSAAASSAPPPARPPPPSHPPPSRAVPAPSPRPPFPRAATPPPRLFRRPPPPPAGAHRFQDGGRVRVRGISAVRLGAPGTRRSPPPVWAAERPPPAAPGRQLSPRPAEPGASPRRRAGPSGRCSPAAACAASRCSAPGLGLRRGRSLAPAGARRPPARGPCPAPGPGPSGGAARGRRPGRGRAGARAGGRLGLPRGAPTVRRPRPGCPRPASARSRGAGRQAAAWGAEGDVRRRVRALSARAGDGGRLSAPTCFGGAPCSAPRPAPLPPGPGPARAPGSADERRRNSSRDLLVNFVPGFRSRPVGAAGPPPRLQASRRLVPTPSCCCCCF